MCVAGQYMNELLNYVLALCTSTVLARNVSINWLCLGDLAS